MLEVKKCPPKVGKVGKTFERKGKRLRGSTQETLIDQKELQKRTEKTEGKKLSKKKTTEFFKAEKYISADQNDPLNPQHSE